MQLANLAPPHVQHIVGESWMRRERCGERERRPEPAVFTGANGGPHRRSNFRRRVWLPLVEGDPVQGWAPILPGMHFMTYVTCTRRG
ncbi:hypothetical protein ACFFSW_26095 [Saccharothrix longispora]|uniref:Uncharacterized protein n=1 Tax=Saccharothrix longispora TaxID=33920 RepID=A0ABU1PP79_9PSEU|nr:hypothetical protein [Saccharothrix longispora]MDR6592465.1 hypothetical protein [Saccharothrix longispora]